MTALDTRGTRVGTRAVASAAARIAQVAGDEVPGDVRVTQDGATVVLSGRNLRERSINDARLRGFGLLAGDGR